MAGAGLIQLVAYGAQDIYLTGSPQITFFKVAYRRHTNFAMEAIEQTFTGVPDFGKKVTATISRNGDLITRAYIEVDLPSVTALAAGSGATPFSGFSWVAELGHFLVNNVNVEIGGQQIDKHYAEWFNLLNQLTLPAGKVKGYNAMIGNVSSLTVPVGSSSHAVAAGASSPAQTMWIPMQFWFNRHPGLALPLIALQYHDVKLNFQFNAFQDLIRGSATAASLGDCTLYIDYIYLDTDERRRFALAQHEYLIEQLQFTGDESLSGISNKIKLAFNHPTKELVFVVQRRDVVTSGAGANEVRDYTNWTNTQVASQGKNPVFSALLQLNGHDRFSVRPGNYFNLVQPYQHHSNIPGTGVCVYSFALTPEEHQPSGTLNFSRIDNATLQLTLDASMSGVTSVVKIFAVNYNVLRLMSGMGGLAYAS